jgi:molybdopterin-guanine dinucleotide biosynthesis protein A
MAELLPVHGFVLAGGKSTRMGEDKALKLFRGMPMIGLAVEKLRGFCTEVGIAGNRDDLGGYAVVIHEKRLEAGPGAGIEAGLMATTQPWVLFVPVDVPLVPAELLRRWVEGVIGAEGADAGGSYLLAEGQAQPAFCLLRRGSLAAWSGLLDHGERRLVAMLGGSSGVGAVGVGAERFASDAERLALWFSNVNTPEDLAAAEIFAVDLLAKNRGIQG